MTDGSEQIFLLTDYVTLRRQWQVCIQGAEVVSLKKLDKPKRESEYKQGGRGMMTCCMLAGQYTVMGVFSKTLHQLMPNVYKNSKQFFVIINDRVLGDGLALPRLSFKNKGFFSIREFSIQAEDGWHYCVKYRAPWVRELLRRTFVVEKGMLEYEPVDFIEFLVEIISTHRPAWIVQDLTD